MLSIKSFPIWKMIVDIMILQDWRLKRWDQRKMINNCKK